MNDKPRFPNKLLVAGITLILGGSLFLLWTLGYFPEPGTFLFTVLIIPVITAGLLILYLVFIKGKTAQLILPGMALLLLGIFFLLYNTVIPEKSIERIWPAFMDIAGLSLIPYALKRKKKARTGLLISAVSLIVLSLLFFPFSLKLTETGFSDFAVKWWPVIIIIIGIIVTGIYIIYKRPVIKPQVQGPGPKSSRTVIGDEAGSRSAKKTSIKRIPIKKRPGGK